MVMLDVDDTIIEVDGYQAGTVFGYPVVRGYNALTGAVSGQGFAPVIMGSQLRKGNTGSSQVAKHVNQNLT